MPIKLTNTKTPDNSFKLNYNYSYSFILNDEIEKHQLVNSFPEDFIELLKEQFGEELKKILKYQQTMTNLKTFQLIYEDFFGTEPSKTITYQHFLYNLTDETKSNENYSLDWWQVLTHHKTKNAKSVLFCFMNINDLNYKRYFISFDFASNHIDDNRLSETFQVHSLKITPEYYEDVESLEKTFEVRFSDRNFKVGDVVELNEFRDDMYTGRRIYKLITYILDDSAYNKEGYVIFSIDDF